MSFAHALIELADGTKIARGTEITVDIDGYDELVEAGAIADEPYDEADEPVLTPDVVEIDGVKYVKASDGASEASDAT